MPLKRHKDPFSHSDWLFELKHDGFRALALVENGICRLVSRNGNAFGSFNVLCSSISGELNCRNAVLDGEIVCLDEQGRSQFDELLFRRGEPRFYAFDLLWCEGKDIRLDGLHERKRKLRSLVPRDTNRLLYCDYIEHRGEDLFSFVCENDLEGVVAKRRNSPYIPENPECHWIKVKNPQYSQLAGRDDLFAYGEPKPVEGSWANCSLACAEAELAFGENAASPFLKFFTTSPHDDDAICRENHFRRKQ
jgi:ATP-dependent DNA ligase